MRLTIPVLVTLAATPLAAGYDLHITRKQEWFDAKGPKISINEWLAVVKTDRSIRRDPENGKFDFLVKIVGEEFPLWYDEDRGELYTKNPSKAAISKLKELAKRLKAKVQGDDCELY